MREALAEAVPATSTEVAPLECWASSAPMPFAPSELLPAAAFAPPEPVRPNEDVGLGVAAVDACDAESAATLVALDAFDVAFDARFEVAAVAVDAAFTVVADATDFDAAAVDSAG